LTQEATESVSKDFFVMPLDGKVKITIDELFTFPDTQNHEKSLVDNVTS